MTRKVCGVFCRAKKEDIDSSSCSKSFQLKTFVMPRFNSFTKTFSDDREQLHKKALVT